MSPTVTVRVARASRAAPCNAGGASAGRATTPSKTATVQALGGPPSSRRGRLIPATGGPPHQRLDRDAEWHAGRDRVEVGAAQPFAPHVVGDPDGGGDEAAVEREPGTRDPCPRIVEAAMLQQVERPPADQRARGG